MCDEYKPEPHPWQIHAVFAKDKEGKKIEERGKPLIQLQWGWMAAMSEEDIRYKYGDAPPELDFVRTTVEDAQALRDKLDELIKLHQESQLPYLLETHTTVEKVYNPLYGDDKVCVCGHTYYRHFDSYDEMSNVGCKYCSCHDFVGRVCEHED